MTNPVVGNPNEFLSTTAASLVGSKLNLFLVGNSRNTTPASHD